ncbi:MAG TPA: GtrA family protein [Candidatus Andersenbacteria bacterium]|nr:GtrA family protein [Candidatus Andersenbacteria bacterium]
MHQMIRYILVGALNVTIDFIVLNTSLLFFELSLFWATFFGFAAGGILGYFLHSRWTFQYDTTGKEALKLSHFLLVAGIGLIITEAIVHLCTNQLGIYYNYSKTIAIIASVAWAYSASKWWVFRKTHEPQI